MSILRRNHCFMTNFKRVYHFIRLQIKWKRYNFKPHCILLFIYFNETTVKLPLHMFMENWIDDLNWKSRWVNIGFFCSNSHCRGWILKCPKIFWKWFEIRYIFYHLQDLYVTQISNEAINTFDLENWGNSKCERKSEKNEFDFLVGNGILPM